MDIPYFSYPDLNERLAAAGLEPLTDEEVEIVHRILSLVIGTARGSRFSTYQLNRLMCLAPTLGYRTERTLRVHDPLLTSAPPVAGVIDREVTGWTDGKQAMRRLGITPSDVDEMWSDATAVDEATGETDGHHALLPLSVVVEFHPPTTWAGLAALIRVGPQDAHERLKRALTIIANHKVAPTEARPGNRNKHSRASTEKYLKASHRLLWTIRDLARGAYRPLSNAVPLAEQVSEAEAAGDEERAAALTKELAAPHPLLVEWQVDLPRLDDVLKGSPDANTDRSAPPIMAVRRSYAGRAARITDLRRRPSDFQGRGLRILRNQLLLVLACVLGARLLALWRIRVRDIDFTHVFPDGVVGPAVKIFPGKTMDAEEARWKGIPEEVAELLREWMRFCGITDMPEKRIWIVGWEKGERRANGRYNSRFGVPGASQSFNGFGGNSVQKSHLVPYENGRSAGYSLHTFRHLAEQVARRVGHAWISENPEWAGRISDQVFADALLDHSFGEADRLGYNDLEADREVFARNAAIGNWHILFGEKGARRVPDTEAIRAAINARDRAIAELAAVEEQIASARARRAELLRGTVEDDEREEPTLEGDERRLVQTLLALINDLRQALRQDRRERREIARLDAELDDLGDLREDLRNDLSRAESRLAEAWTMTVPVDDLLPDGEYAALLAAAPDAPVAAPTATEPEILRDEITTSAFAEAVGVSGATMRRWLASKTSPYWTPETFDRIVRTLSERNRRIRVGELDHSAIPPGAMREIRRMQSERD